MSTGTQVAEQRHRTTGAQRAHSRLAKKQAALNKLYEKTPRIYPDTRQIRRQEVRIKLKELTALQLKEQRKLKRNKNSGETATTVS